MVTREKHSTKPVPLAKGLPLAGQTFKVLRDPLKLLLDLKMNYEDVVKVRFGLKDYYLLQSPAAARHVLQENARNYYKPGAARLMKRILGDGLATSNGELWKNQRRLMQPAFHRNRLTGFIEIAQSESADLVGDWKQKDGQVVDISSGLFRLTLSNITKAMFGTDVRARVAEVGTLLTDMMNYSSDRVRSLIRIPLSIPTPKNNRFKKSEARFDSIIYEIIGKRISEQKNAVSNGHDDLLQMLLDAFHDESNPLMNEKLLRDEITTIFMAGHETTSQTLGWILYHLAQNDESYLAVHNESISENGTAGSFQHMTYTRSVIEEAMRLYPPVWVIARKSHHQDTISDFAIPPGATVLINVYGIHHDPRYWDLPSAFTPARFSTGFSASHSPFTYMPFGGGQRLCIGQHFAMMVMQVVVTQLVKNFYFRIPAGFVPVIDPNLTLRAKEGIRLIIKRHTK